MRTSTAEIRQMFLDFFRRKGHQIISSSSLIPDNDHTLLFTNAGMNQFKDIFLNLDNCSHQRIATSQHCIRAGGKHNDLENVGYTTRHHTFFEMLGNFSFGDYFKYDAIKFAWELLTSNQWFNIPKEKLWVTVYATDDETYNIWSQEIGIPINRIARIGDNQGNAYNSDNFWQMGDSGPCGPCSEIFYDHGDHIYGNPPGSQKEKGDRYIEIWNLVFMQFNRQYDGNLSLLPKPSVDTGMGLERIVAVLQNVNSNYSIDLFQYLIYSIAKIISINDINNKSLHVIADHIRSSAFLISNGVTPSNEGRGYVLRKIIRRAIRHGNILGVQDAFFYKLVVPLIEIMGSEANQILSNQKMIENILYVEEKQFYNIIKRGLNLLHKELTKIYDNNLHGEIAFYLYDTYGLPLDYIIDVCRQYNIEVDKVGFEKAKASQRQLSKASNNFIIDDSHVLKVDKKTIFVGYEQLKHQGIITAIFKDNKMVNSILKNEKAILIMDKTPFYYESSGQIGDSGILRTESSTFEVFDTQKYGKAIGHIGKLSYGEIKLGAHVICNVNELRRNLISINHSATHLLHAALKQVLDKHIQQRGSLIQENHLRFDFSYNKVINKEQIYHIENIVNNQIKKNLLIQTEFLTLEEARKKNAIALFSNKYDINKVRVISIGDFSIELCSGTHTKRTGNIGLFYITYESSIAAGVHRIEAITNIKILELLNHQNKLINEITHLIKSDKQMIIEKIINMQNKTYQMGKEIQQLRNRLAKQVSISLSRYALEINGTKILVKQLDNIEPIILKSIVENLKNQLGSAIIVLVTVIENKFNLIAYVTKDLTHRIKAKEIVIDLTKIVGGKGGGRSDLAQAGGNNSGSLKKALIDLDAILIAKLKI